MDFEPYDEAKHGTAVKRGRPESGEWRAFFDALSSGPLVLPKTRFHTLHKAAERYGYRVATSQLMNGERIVVHLLEKL